MVLSTDREEKESHLKSLWNTIVDYISGSELYESVKAFNNDSIPVGSSNYTNVNNATATNSTNANESKFVLFLEHLFHLSKIASIAIFCSICLGFLLILILLIYCLFCRKRDLKMKRGFESLNYADFPDLSEGKSTKEALYGKIEYSVEYKSKKQELRIGVVQAKDIPTHGGPTLSPYAILTLINSEPNENPDKPPKITRKEKRTKTVKKSNSPCWNEYFTFKVGNREIQNHTFKFEVFDCDDIGIDRKLGQLEIALADMNFQLFMDKTFECTTPLDKGDDLVIGSGDVCIVLKYHKATETLRVTLLEMKRLQVDVKKLGRRPDLIGSISCFYNKKKIGGKVVTQSRSFSENPYFDETASFSLTEDKLHHARVQVKVYYQGIVPSQKTCFGKTTLCLNSRYPACVMHWKDMMSDHRKQVAFWHVLRYPKDDDYDPNK